MLDHPKIDIFIHMDAKNRSYNPAETLKLTKYSRIFHAPRIKVSWGGYSQINAELILLEAATSQGHYEHYHLLSGADLPIQKREDIIKFFEEHHGIEFVHSSTVPIKDTDEVFMRMKYYHLLQDLHGRPARKNIIMRILRKTERTLLHLQKLIHISRNKGINFYWGSNWFSITDELARYVLTKREWIHRTFHNTLCCDEFFLQTIAMESKFQCNLFRINGNQPGNVRLIDWKRGEPYTFRLSDIEELKASKAMFARKFSPSADREVIEKIRELYS
ncbi:MAG: hypothetical protein IJR85_11295 [Synergistaceae bacterium]|nr:hypothetical protein [Synergistaceae bacterium]